MNLIFGSAKFMNMSDDSPDLLSVLFVDWGLTSETFRQSVRETFIVSAAGQRRSRKRRQILDVKKKI